jgi:hypothetical protein
MKDLDVSERERSDSSSAFFFVRERARGDEDKVGNKR